MFQDTLSEYQTTHLVKRVPTVLEYASFIFSFGNLLAGPCTEFRDYKDFIEAKGVSHTAGDAPSSSSPADTRSICTLQIKFVRHLLVVDSSTPSLQDPFPLIYCSVSRRCWDRTETHRAVRCT